MYLICSLIQERGTDSTIGGKDDGVSLCIWDFAGHDIYYTTHQVKEASLLSVQNNNRLLNLDFIKASTCVYAYIKGYIWHEVISKGL